MRLYRGKDDRLNGLVGGAVAGLSILFEKKERRVDIAQQMLVRYKVRRDTLYGKIADFVLILEPFKLFIMLVKQETFFTSSMVTLYCSPSLAVKCYMLIPCDLTHYPQISIRSC